MKEGIGISSCQGTGWDKNIGEDLFFLSSSSFIFWPGNNFKHQKV